jgi:hypothetical protein
MSLCPLLPSWILNSSRDHTRKVKVAARHPSFDVTTKNHSNNSGNSNQKITSVGSRLILAEFIVESIELLQKQEREHSVRAKTREVGGETFPQCTNTFFANQLHQHVTNSLDIHHHESIKYAKIRVRRMGKHANVYRKFRNAIHVLHILDSTSIALRWASSSPAAQTHKRWGADLVFKMSTGNDAAEVMNPLIILATTCCEVPSFIETVQRNMTASTRTTGHFNNRKHKAAIHDEGRTMDYEHFLDLRIWRKLRGVQDHSAINSWSDTLEILQKVE